MAEPITVPCEGSGLPGHRCVCPDTHALCAMCGRVMEADPEGRMPGHDRVDILAQLARGDYG